MAVAEELGYMDRTWYTPYIPVDKANKARANVKMPADESILVLFNAWRFGSVNGLLIGVRGLYSKYIYNSPEYTSWEEFLANPVKEGGWIIGLKVAGRSWQFDFIKGQAWLFS